MKQLRREVARSLFCGLVFVVVWFITVQCLRAVVGELSPAWISSALHGPLPLLIYVCLVVGALLLPLSPATVVVLVGIEIFGPGTAFSLALLSGAIAESISFSLGRAAQRLKWNANISRMRQATALVREHRRRLVLVTILLRAVPNPLYDVWGYVCGWAGMPYGPYIVASVLGGSIPLAVICFVGGLAQATRP